MHQFNMLWKDGKEKLLTFSYDDGVVQDRKLLKIMRENGLRGTFNLNSGFLGWKDDIIRDDKVVDHSHVKPDEVAELYEGMEVAVHTVTHPDLVQLEDADALQEVLQDRAALEKLVGYPVHGMAYPFGTTDERIQSMLHSCGIRYARGVETTADFKLPKDPLNWACSCHHYDLEELIDPFLADDQELKCLTVWGHSYEFDQKDEWDKIEGQMERLGGHDNVWYATNGEMFDYIADFKRLDVTLDGRTIYNPSAQTIWIRMDGQKYEIRGGEWLRLEENCKEEHPFRIWKG